MARVLRNLLAAIFATGICLVRAACAEPFVAEVRVNGQVASDLMVLDRDGESLGLRAEDFDRLGLIRPPDVAGGAAVPLSSVPGLAYQVDGAGQSVAITAPPSAFRTFRAQAGFGPAGPPDRAATGLALIYGVSGGWDRGRARADMVGEARLFGPAGVVSHAFTLDSSGRSRRLETRYVIENPLSARRLVIGDFATSGPGWNGAAFAGGVSLSSDATLRPEDPPQPLARIADELNGPSSIELYANGVRQFVGEAPPGPLVITAAPMVDGQGRLSIVAQDALGRRTERTVTFYAARDLLAEGRFSYALEAGKAREWRGLRSRYDATMANAAVRYGLNDRLTLEGAARTVGDRSVAGAGVVAKVREAALINAVFRTTGDEGGGQVTLGVRRQTRAFSVFASMTRSDRAFERAVRDMPGEGPTRFDQVGASVSSDRFGDFSISYSRLSDGERPLTLSSATWSRGFGRFDMRATAALARAERTSMVVRLGVSAPLGGGGGWMGGGVTRSRSGARIDAEISRPPPGVTGFGWRAAMDAPVSGGEGGGARGELEGRLSTSVGEAGAAAAFSNGRASARAYASGSLVLMGGRLTPASSLGSSFALVEVGQRDVEVMADNRVVGRTGRDGRFLATQLASLSETRIEIAPTSLDLAYAMPAAPRTIRPPRGVGVRVRLPVVRQRALLVRLVDPAGRPLEAGATIILNGAGGGRTGFDGEAFLGPLQDHNEIKVLTPGWTCRAELSYAEPAEASPTPDLVCAPIDRRDLAPRRVADGGQRGAELSAADRGSDVSGVRGEQGHGDRRDGVRRDALRVQRPGLRGLRLLLRNTGRWLGIGGRPPPEARNDDRDLEIRALP